MGDVENYSIYLKIVIVLCDQCGDINLARGILKENVRIYKSMEWYYISY